MKTSSIFKLCVNNKGLTLAKKSSAFKVSLFIFGNFFVYLFIKNLLSTILPYP